MFYGKRYIAVFNFFFFSFQVEADFETFGANVTKLFWSSCPSMLMNKSVNTRKYFQLRKIKVFSF
jgi:hypothetical protein